LRVRDQVLLHLLHHPRGDSYYAPDELTQRGLAIALDTSDGYLVQTLIALEKEGLIHREKGRVRNRNHGVLIITLTAEGERAIRSR
jgi:DNA-binding MarR family transcriptional regulator